MEPGDHDRHRRNRILRELVAELDARFPGEQCHAANVAVYSVAMAAELIPGEELLAVRYAAELRHIGRVGSGSLNNAHPVRSAELMALHPFLSDSREMVRHHHEWWNGGGYPDGLAGRRIPLGSRIIAVAETFDAMTMPLDRRGQVSESEALKEIWNQAGRQFDPAVVQAFFRVQPVIQPVGL